MIKVDTLIDLLKKNKSDFYSGVPDSVLKEFSSSLKNNKGMRISDVAHESGYNDSRYFSTTFKKFFGKSPKDY